MDLFTDLFGSKDQINVAQECSRALVIFLFGLAMLRLSGRRTFAQWSALDTIIIVVAGSALGRAMTANAPFIPTLAAVAVLVGLHVLFAWGVTRSRLVSKVVEGSPIILGENGSLNEDRRINYLISEADLGEALRQRGIDHPSQTKTITLEPSGSITVIKA
jgi:uncharacterized membrane protein YcaP (DUF421 family)